MRVDSCSSVLVWVLYGLLAGCTFATYVLATFMICDLGRFAVRWDRIPFNVYVDDILLRWCGRETADVLHLSPSPFATCSKTV